MHRVKILFNTKQLFLRDKNKTSYPAFNVALGKTLIASAWVDGNLNKKELAVLKSIILQLPYISFEDWRKLKIYLAYPISTSEQDNIIKEFTDKVYHKGHMMLAWNAIREILKADGQVTDDEKKFIKELEDTLQHNSSNFLKKFRYFFLADNIKSQSAWPKPKTGRDKFIHEFFENPTYFLFRKAILKENVEVVGTKHEWQKICLISAILCYVANEDGKIDLTEKKYIHNLLVSELNLGSRIAHLVIRVALQIEISELKLHETCKSLRDSCSKDEARKVFKLVAKLSLVDGKLSAEEIETLRIIALFLDIESKIWIEIVLASNK